MYIPNQMDHLDSDDYCAGLWGVWLVIIKVLGYNHYGHIFTYTSYYMYSNHLLLFISLLDNIINPVLSLLLLHHHTHHNNSHNNIPTRPHKLVILQAKLVIPLPRLDIPQPNPIMRLLKLVMLYLSPHTQFPITRLTRLPHPTHLLKIPQPSPLTILQVSINRRDLPLSSQLLLQCLEEVILRDNKPLIHSNKLNKLLYQMR